MSALPPSALGARILVVEDSAVVRERVLRILARHGFQTSTALDESGIMAVLDQQACDAILLDLGLPSGDGISITRSIRRHSRIPILMLTGRASVQSRVAGLEAGADDYVVKPFAPEELVARLKAVLRRVGEPAPERRDPTALRLGPALLRLDLNELHGPGGRERLTQREARLLLALGRSGGRLARPAAYREAFERDWRANDRSLDVHVANLRGKLARVGAGAKFITTLHGFGYGCSAPITLLFEALDPVPAETGAPGTPGTPDPTGRR